MKFEWYPNHGWFLHAYIYIYENYNPHHGSELDISLLLYTPIFYIYINVFMYYITCCQLFFAHYHLSHDGSMYGVHMLTWLGYIDGIHVGSPPGGSSPCSHGSDRISSPVLLRAAPRPCDQSAPAVRIQRRCSRSPWRWEICANYVLNGLINIVMNIVINSD